MWITAFIKCCLWPWSVSQYMCLCPRARWGSTVDSEHHKVVMGESSSCVAITSLPRSKKTRKPSHECRQPSAATGHPCKWEGHTVNPVWAGLCNFKLTITTKETKAHTKEPSMNIVMGHCRPQIVRTVCTLNMLLWNYCFISSEFKAKSMYFFHIFWHIIENKGRRWINNIGNGFIKVNISVDTR